MGGPHAAPPQSTGENRIATWRLPEAIAPGGAGRTPVRHGLILPEPATCHKRLHVMPRFRRPDTFMSKIGEILTHMKRAEWLFTPCMQHAQARAGFFRPGRAVMAWTPWGLANRCN